MFALTDEGDFNAMVVLSPRQRRDSVGLKPSRDFALYECSDLACGKGVALRLAQGDVKGKSFYSRVASQTINTEMSAGLTPEILPAWPKLNGLIRLSFSCASKRKPLIVV